MKYINHKNAREFSFYNTPQVPCFFGKRKTLTLQNIDEDAGYL